ncbi:type II secretion system ATPase GspE [Candidatus Calescamantes bacterium]|nr:type II secretion system ATPase GspE [Candidatus Calescamantes bacterium]
MANREQEIWKDILVNIGLVTEEQLSFALREQDETGEKLSDVLVRMGYISREDLTRALSAHFGLIPVKLSEYHPTEDVIARVPPSMARKYKIIPLEFKDGVLTIAVSDPLDFLSIDSLEKVLGVKLKAVLTSDREIEQAISRYYGVEEETIDTILEELTEQDISFAEGVAQETEEVELAEEAPIIRLVSLLILEAFRSRASDIHVEPMANRLRIRYRIDGILHEVPAPPKRLEGAVISRIKILSGMDIAEKRLPQDGRIMVNVLGRHLDLRVSSLPGIHGESVVMRILDKSSLLLGITELGFLEEDLERWKRVISLPNGIILVTGPTGSGKTTTLYAVLNELNLPDRKIITIEDPVEYQLSGINQLQVKPQIGLTFASSLRSILRQSPDIIMVGEIRDTETAEIAVRAALTGHLVFSTLHTNDAAGAVTRLIDMGIKPFLVASAVQAVMAQRLVRKVCPKCTEPYTPDPSILKEIERAVGTLDGANFVKGKGCPECNMTGYRGRIAIFELLVISEELRRLILSRATSFEIRELARSQGMKLLREDGWIKVYRGITTVEEVLRVTQQDVVEGVA